VSPAPKDPDTAREWAATLAGLRRDADAAPQLREMLPKASPRLQRIAADALGRIGDKEAPMALVAALAVAPATDDFLIHSLTLALSETSTVAQQRAMLDHPTALVRRAGLMLLAQGTSAEQKWLKEQLRALLMASDLMLRDAAWWVVGRRPGDFPRAAAIVVEELDRIPSDEAARWKQADWWKRGELLAQEPHFHRLIIESALLVNNRPKTIRMLQAGGVKSLPRTWEPRLQKELGKNSGMVFEIVQQLPMSTDAFRAFVAGQEAEFEKQWSYYTASPVGFAALPESREADLLKQLSGPEPQMALEVLTKLQPTPTLWRQLPGVWKKLPATERPRLLAILARTSDKATGLELLAALTDPVVRAGFRAADLEPVLKKFPPEVQGAAKPLWAAFAADRAGLAAKLERIAKELSAGDVSRGQVVFQSKKAACATCHMLGYVGGDVGPDLTKIGSIRTESDLLES
ncbi:MAG: HEAT repeat domain-containing protein, partial [Gemmataceae bacterium]